LRPSQGSYIYIMMIVMAVTICSSTHVCLNDLIDWLAGDVKT
jgi:hypothetical protein